MNAIKCFNCGKINSTNENFCLNCGSSLQNLPAGAYVSLSPQDHAQAFGFDSSAATNAFAINSELGRKVWFWYCVYTIFMAMLYLLLAGFGGLIAFGSLASNSNEASEMAITGTIYLVAGIVFFFPFITAPFLPKKPWTWIYGIVLIALGLSSCCLLPVTVPLIIYWLKPETKAFFGRN
jgi:hypothetical protein